MKSVRIRSFPGPNAEKYGPEKLRIRTLSRSAQHHVRYILTKRFFRELLENYFGIQRLLGTRKKLKDNPSSKDLDIICMKHHI